MPNGRPGDHPLTDIARWNKDVFNPTIDGLVREIARCPGYAAVFDQVAKILWKEWPHRQDVVTDYAKVLRELSAIRDSLRDPPGG